MAEYDTLLLIRVDDSRRRWQTGTLMSGGGNGEREKGQRQRQGGGEI